MIRASNGREVEVRASRPSAQPFRVYEVPISIRPAHRNRGKQMMRKLSAEIQECAERCQTCASTCLNAAMNHCLESGGEHTEPHHFRLMIACSEICRASAAILLTGIREHAFVCRACAEICRACAESCRKVGDMQECVDACTRCAESCEKMSATSRQAA